MEYWHLIWVWTSAFSHPTRHRFFQVILSKRVVIKQSRLPTSMDPWQSFSPSTLFYFSPRPIPCFLASGRSHVRILARAQEEVDRCSGSFSNCSSFSVSPGWLTSSRFSSTGPMEVLMSPLRFSSLTPSMLFKASLLSWCLFANPGSDL